MEKREMIKKIAEIDAKLSNDKTIKGEERRKLIDKRNRLEKKLYRG